MQPHLNLLVEVWSEVCRHLDLRESAVSVAALLRSQLPLGELIIRRIDLEHSVLETVGTGGGSGKAATRTPLRPEQLERLLAWCQRGAVTRLEDGELRTLLLDGTTNREALAGPLRGRDGPAGVLVLVAEAEEAFGADHLELAGALLEPFAVALENDRGLREMATHCEAAEADRRSLLTKLGRQDISEIIVGAETGLRHVMARANLVAGSDIPILILGETGSGKEVIARAIHRRSGRSAGPFLRVNCGALPPELIDSELFGHEKGSFTGAISLRKGWFERADGGTLFLDEVAELPPAAQVRFLRILQDGTFERVGGQRQLTVDVRVVAATNRDLHGMVGEGRFRDDLWYRLAVFPIRLPSLRERPEDMPALATHFAERAAKRFGLPFLAPTLEDIDLLVAYSWPGNIRELAAVMDRAAILGDGRRLEVAKSLGAATPAALNGEDGLGPVGTARDDGFPKLDNVIKSHIEEALRRTHGRIEGPQGAARLLGVNPHTLRARMRKLGIDWKQFR